MNSCNLFIISIAGRTNSSNTELFFKSKRISSSIDVLCKSIQYLIEL